MNQLVIRIRESEGKQSFLGEIDIDQAQESVVVLYKTRFRYLLNFILFKTLSSYATTALWKEDIAGKVKTFFFQLY